MNRDSRHARSDGRAPGRILPGVSDDPCLMELTGQSGTAPFLKWLGGKRWLVRQGVHVPDLSSESTFYEPFLGAGSMFFALDPTNAVLSDINSDLIATYRALRDHPTQIIARLSRMEGDLDTYLNVRASSPNNLVDRAVRFIYLNRTAYGGMYRVNAAGEFNVPYGKYARRVCQPEVLRKCSEALQGVAISTGGFSAAMKRAQAGDFVYLDPPYSTHGPVEVFGRYHAKPFTWKMHQLLAKEARALQARGVHVLISNSAHPQVLKLYARLTVTLTKRSSVLAKDPRSREIVAEALISSYPMPA